MPHSASQCLTVPHRKSFPVVRHTAHCLDRCSSSRASPPPLRLRVKKRIGCVGRIFGLLLNQATTIARFNATAFCTAARDLLLRPPGFRHLAASSRTAQGPSRMSDTSGGDSGGLPKKKSFSSRISKKLHNPFKRSNSTSSSDDESSKSPGSAKSRKSKPSFIPSMPINFSISPSSPESETGPAKRGIARREAGQALGPPPPVPPRQPAAVEPPGAAAVAAAAPAAAPAAPAVSPARAPAGTTDTLPSQSAAPAANASATAATAATAAAAAGGQESGDVPTGGAAAATGAAAAAPVPPKPRTVVGGPVFGAPSIVMMGVKGDPDAAMLNLRTRGFIVHLVRRFLVFCLRV